jgi:DNA-binding MarR family transcriptional regulator
VNVPLDKYRYNDYYPAMNRRARNGSRQKKPVHSLEEDVFVNLQRTADVLLRRVEETLKPHGLSPTQYNVLRILRGAASKGLACREIAKRMITRDPDVTRLLDRLEARGWIARARESGDRRVITTRITAKGLNVLKALDEPVSRGHARELKHVKKNHLHVLNRLLTSVRSKM